MAAKTTGKEEGGIEGSDPESSKKGKRRGDSHLSIVALSSSSIGRPSRIVSSRTVLHIKIAVSYACSMGTRSSPRASLIAAARDCSERRKRVRSRRTRNEGKRKGTDDLHRSVVEDLIGEDAILSISTSTLRDLGLVEALVEASSEPLDG